MTKYAVIEADHYDFEIGRVVSQHRTEQAAEAALLSKGLTPWFYVSRRKPDGQWESRIEARARREAR